MSRLLREYVTGKEPMRRQGRKKQLPDIIVLVITVLLAIPLLTKAVTGYATFFGYKPIFILTDSMEPVIPAGSWVVGIPVCAEDLAAGDVAAYRKENNTGFRPLIIHRVVGISEEGYLFKGDNNKFPDSRTVSAEQILYRIIYPKILQ